MTDAEQFTDIKLRSNSFSNVVTRQVQGGYVLQAQTQYADKGTGGILATQNAEAITTTPEQASTMLLNWLRGGSFDAQPIQPNLGQPDMLSGGASLGGAPATI